MLTQTNIAIGSVASAAISSFGSSFYSSTEVKLLVRFLKIVIEIKKYIFL